MKDDIELPKTDEELLLKCGFRCTLCGRTDLQIHHIDGNHGNNIPENKTVLCQEHHDQAQKDIQIINSGNKIQTATKLLTPELLIIARNERIKKINETSYWRAENEILHRFESLEIKMKLQQEEIENIKNKNK